MRNPHQPTTLTDLLTTARSMVSICTSVLREGLPLSQSMQQTLLETLDAAHCQLDEALQICPDAEFEREVKLKLL